MKASGWSIIHGDTTCRGRALGGLARFTTTSTPVSLWCVEDLLEELGDFEKPTAYQWEVSGHKHVLVRWVAGKEGLLWMPYCNDRERFNPLLREAGADRWHLRLVKPYRAESMEDTTRSCFGVKPTILVEDFPVEGLVEKAHEILRYEASGAQFLEHVVASAKGKKMASAFGTAEVYSNSWGIHTLLQTVQPTVRPVARVYDEKHALLLWKEGDKQHFLWMPFYADPKRFNPMMGVRGGNDTRWIRITSPAVVSDQTAVVLDAANNSSYREYVLPLREGLVSWAQNVLKNEATATDLLQSLGVVPRGGYLFEQVQPLMQTLHRLGYHGRSSLLEWTQGTRTHLMLIWPEGGRVQFAFLPDKDRAAIRFGSCDREASPGSFVVAGAAIPEAKWSETQAREAAVGLLADSSDSDFIDLEVLSEGFSTEKLRELVDSGEPLLEDSVGSLPPGGLDRAVTVARGFYPAGKLCFRIEGRSYSLAYGTSTYSLLRDGSSIAPSILDGESFEHVEALAASLSRGDVTPNFQLALETKPVVQALLDRNPGAPPTLWTWQADGSNHAMALWEEKGQVTFYWMPYYDHPTNARVRYGTYDVGKKIIRVEAKDDGLRPILDMVEACPVGASAVTENAGFSTVGLSRAPYDASAHSLLACFRSQPPGGLSSIQRALGNPTVGQYRVKLSGKEWALVFQGGTTTVRSGDAADLFQNHFHDLERLAATLTPDDLLVAVPKVSVDTRDKSVEGNDMGLEAATRAAERRRDEIRSMRAKAAEVFLESTEKAASDDLLSQATASLPYISIKQREAPGAIATGEQIAVEASLQHVASSTTHTPIETEENSMNKPVDTNGEKTINGQSAAQPSRARAILDEAKLEANEAAWCTAATQLVKLTHEPLVGLVLRHLGDDSTELRKKVGDALNTEIGRIMVMGMLATAMTALPGGMGGSNPQVLRLSKELRVGALSGGGDLAADLLMGPLRAVLAAYLQGEIPSLPPATPPALSEGVPSSMFEDEGALSNVR